MYHSKLLSFLKTALELNVCEKFTQYPRCLRGTETSTAKLCRFHLENTFNVQYAINLGEVDFKKELHFKYYINDQSLKESLKAATEKLIGITKTDQNVSIYVGMTVGTGESRHSGNRELPLGSIVKDIIYTPNKNSAQQLEACLIENLKKEIGNRVVNISKGGQNSAALEDEPHTIYVGIIRTSYASLARGQMNRPTNELRDYNKNFKEASTKTEKCDIGVILGEKLVKNLPQTNCLALLKYFNILHESV